MSENTFLWSCFWQSTACLTAGLIVSLALKRQPARAHRVLFLAMIAAVLVPMMSTLVKHLEMGLFVAKPPVVEPEVQEQVTPNEFQTTAPVPVEDFEPAASALEEYSAPPPVVRSQGVKIPWGRIVLLTWISASLILALRLFLTFIMGIRLLHRALPLCCEEFQKAARLARAKLGISSNVEICSSQSVRSPVIWCWAKQPVLLVPRTGHFDHKIDWVSVICHELAHRKRHDHITGLITELAVCILPWNLLLWWAKKRLVRLSEQACDDWVVATGQPGTDYAESLLELAPQGQMAFAPAVVASKKALPDRIRRILQDKCANPRTGLRWTLLVSILAVVVVTAIAFAQTRPAEPETSSGPVMLSTVRELVARNEALTSLIKMDYMVRYERTGEQDEPKAVGRRSRRGRPYAHLRGVWAQNREKQYLKVESFHAGDELANRTTKVIDGHVMKMWGGRPDRIGGWIQEIRFDWAGVAPVRLGPRPFEGLRRLSEVLVPEYASVHDDREVIDGRKAYVVDVRRPAEHTYYARVWIDCERGMPLRLEYYDLHPTDSQARLMSDVKPIELHGLANGAWIPVRGVRSIYWRDGRTTSEHITIEPDSIKIGRRDVPDSLFSFQFPEGAKVYDVTTGHTFIQGQPQRSVDQVLQTAGKSIAGRVVDENDTPVPGVVVKTTYHLTKREDGKLGFRIINGHDRLSYITDDQGRFAVEVEQDGRYDLTFSSKNHAGFIAYGVPIGTGDLKVSIHEGGTVTGRVVRIENGRKVGVPHVEVSAEHKLTNFTYMGFEHDKKTLTDSEGRFRFTHLRTKMRRYKKRSVSEEHRYVPRSWKISTQGASTTVTFRDTTKIGDVELVVTPDLGTPLPLLGKPLPEFDGIDINFGAEQAKGKKILVCFWDMNQRPSRHLVRELAKRAEELKEEDGAVVCVEASKVDRKELDDWVKKYNIPFPVGMVEGDAEEQVRFAWGVKSLPWLILSDRQHIVRAEGFGLEELDEKIKANKRTSNPRVPGTGGTRIVRFPKGRSIGNLYVIVGKTADPTDSWIPPLFGFDCKLLGEAQGEVKVPANKMLRLDAWKVGRGFSALKPDDIQLLTVYNGDESVAKDIARLTALQGLWLSWSDDATVEPGLLRHLIGLKKLKWLRLHSYIPDKDLAYLSKLPSLEHLHFWGPALTNSKMAQIGKITSLTHLALEAGKIGKGLAHLKALKSLRYLSLRGNTNDDIDQFLVHVGELTQLEELDLRDTEVSDAGLAHLSRMTKLKKLQLGSNPPTLKITDAGMAHLKKLKSLEELDLPYEGITDVGLTHLAELNFLKKINAQGRGITDEGLKAIAKIKSLEDLSIRSRNVTDVAMANIAQCLSLKCLGLNDCSITDAGLAHLAKLKSLTKLSIVKTHITGDGLAVLKQLPSLTHLTLAFMKPGETGIDQLEGLTSLQKLWLAYLDLNIGDDELAIISTLSSLKDLDMRLRQESSTEPFTDEGLAHLAKLTGLQSLQLDGNKMITNDGFKNLSKLTALEFVQMHQCEKINNAGLKNLEGLSSLRFLRLGDSRVTEAGMTRLKKKIPALTYHLSSEKVAKKAYGGGRFRPMRRR